METSERTALSSPEILEAILLELDMRTLLTSAQLTCKGWRALIIHSPSLQQALFFRPVKQDAEKRYNPLLAETFPSFFPTRHATHHNADSATPTSSHSSIRVPGEAPSLLRLEISKNPEKRGAYLHVNASWRRMLIQQPPVRGLAHISVTSGQIGFGYSRYILHGKDLPGDEADANYAGIRMNIFYDLILKQPISESRIYWWGKVPPNVMDHRADGIRDMFKNTVAESDVILYTTSVYQCVQGIQRPPHPEEEMMRQIAFPVRDWGAKLSFHNSTKLLPPDLEGHARYTELRRR
ncbi:uncharacterized protein BDW43DRAFT_276825 [Aspergillus alliaceus]|uniref:uncharacterized protein n=1 Tax=Petromyces alliaceus TaxID=209559 RepID=UPI0012A76B52|nr:uncharacterized protein BDW43DRAFT_276825 [Aspergillus alliaceus]KAB8233271.1 hypothetical protein BDW43DRAFT_276825 [Aspergillus alliaceus]